MHGTMYSTSAIRRWFGMFLALDGAVRGDTLYEDDCNTGLVLIVTHLGLEKRPGKGIMKEIHWDNPGLTPLAAQCLFDDHPLYILYASARPMTFPAFFLQLNVHMLLSRRGKNQVGQTRYDGKLRHSRHCARLSWVHQLSFPRSYPRDRLPKVCTKQKATNHQASIVGPTSMI